MNTILTVSCCSVSYKAIRTQPFMGGTVTLPDSVALGHKRGRKHYPLPVSMRPGEKCVRVRVCRLQTRATKEQINSVMPFSNDRNWQSCGVGDRGSAG